MFWEWTKSASLTEGSSINYHKLNVNQIHLAIRRYTLGWVNLKFINMEVLLFFAFRFVVGVKSC